MPVPAISEKLFIKCLCLTNQTIRIRHSRTKTVEILEGIFTGFAVRGYLPTIQTISANCELWWFGICCHEIKSE